MASLADILEYKRAEEQAAAEAFGDAAIIAGLAGGAGVGAAAGAPLYSVGNAANKLRAMVNPEVVRQGPFTRLAPGPRVAGGLVGLIVGGALGNQIRSNALEQNTASSLLAKAQTGKLSKGDESLLETLIEEYYDVNGMG